MKNLILLLLVLCIISCTKETIENPFNSQNETLINTKSRNENMNIAENIELQYGLEIASYIAGRILLNSTEARNQVINLSIANNGTISLETLLDTKIDTPFKIAFINEFNYLSIKPGDENGIEPLMYQKILDDLNNSMEEQGLSKVNSQSFLIFLTKINCLEFYFPMPLNFNMDDMRITVSVVRLDNNDEENVGGELYYYINANGNKINEGEVVNVNIDYVNEMVNNSNNLIIVRPNRAQNDTSNYCAYPYDIYPVDDFTVFLN